MDRKQRGDGWLWYLGDGALPNDMSRRSVIKQLKDAVNNITGSYTDCPDFADDEVSAKAKYMGKTSVESDIKANGGCFRWTDTDGVDTVDFGDLPGTTLGVTCSWTGIGRPGPNSILETDVKIDVDDKLWAKTQDSCLHDFDGDAYDLRGVVTHEVGHAFGLGDMSESAHPKLTMSGISAQCEVSQRTLGAGDVLGLRSLY